MALATTITLASAVGSHLGSSQIIRPSQIASAWYTAVPAGVLNAQDAATITAPATEIVGAVNRIFVSENGTLLRLRVKYDAGISAVTDPILRLFGRLNSSDSWQSVQNQDEQTAITVTTDLTNDVSDGTWNWTLADLNAHTFDKDGCQEFLIGIQTALAATGTVSTATIEIKEL